LKRKLRDIIAGLLGLCLIMLGFTRRAKTEIFENGFITGIYFHNPSRNLFEKSVKWLKKNRFNIIDTNTLLKILQKNQSAPPGTVWLSLDDGWKDNMTNVVPFAVKNNIPVTFFISTGPVESSGVFWWTLTEEFQSLLPEPYNKDPGRLWKIPENTRVKIIDELSEKTRGKYSREAMSIDDVKKISSSDYLTIGSHTVNHVITPNCTDEELRWELEESKRKLESWTGKTINTFCFPNADFSGKEEILLKQSGYEMAVVAGNKFITPDTKIYSVPRFSVGEGYFTEELCHMFGVWQKAVKKIKSII
jgi:peptidoglycan/xylan/chitin deacetylase (PgdA/CDA1 family)